MGRVVRGVKCPWGEMSVGRNVRGVKCPWGKMSWGELLWGELSWGELSWGELSWGKWSGNLQYLTRYTHEMFCFFEEYINFKTVHYLSHYGVIPV